MMVFILLKMKKNEVTNIKELEKYYDKVRKIKFTDESQINSIEDIIEYLFIKEEPTFRTRNGFHCEAGKYRSISDYIVLCKYYFPKKKIKTFFKKFIQYDKRMKRREGKSFHISYCGNIRKTNIRGFNYYITSNLKESFSIDFGNGLVFKIKELINY